MLLVSAALYQMVYFIFLCGSGMTISRLIFKRSFDRLIAGFLFGSILVSLYLFMLADMMYLYAIWLYPLLFFAVISTLLNSKLFWRSCVDVIIAVLSETGLLGDIGVVLARGTCLLEMSMLVAVITKWHAVKETHCTS